MIVTIKIENESYIIIKIIRIIFLIIIIRSMIPKCKINIWEGFKMPTFKLGLIKLETRGE